MGNCVLCESLHTINWLWFAASVVVVFAVGALWHSLLFAQSWAKTFKVEIPKDAKPASFILTFLTQFVASALFGFALFVMVKFSVCLAALALVAFCGWEKGGLKFQFPVWKQFVTAALIRTGYTFVSGVIFILFALI